MSTASSSNIVRGMRPKRSKATSSRPPRQLPSAKFAKIYESLPAEIQLTFLEEQLLPLLDSIDAEKADQVLSSVLAFQTRLQRVPALDLKGKKKEIDSLFDRLQKDSKISIKERSDRQELLEELFDSVTSWLNDIWIMVYEHRIAFVYAHTCLLFVTEVMSRLDGVAGGCKCSITNMPVNVTIRTQSGKLVKDFSVSGPHGVQRVILWIWRDLFVSLLARGSSWDKQKVPEMLENLVKALDWRALERLLYGGKASVFGGGRMRGDEDEDEDDDEDEDEDDEDQDSDYGGSMDEDTDDEDASEDDEADDEDEDGNTEWGTDAEDDEPAPRRLRATHWPPILNAHRSQLQDLISTQLRNLFTFTPSFPLFMTITSLSLNLPETHNYLFTTLSQNATSTPDTFVAALEIFSAESQIPRVLALLASHSHLLRPRDAKSLQLATVTISDSPAYRAHAIPIITKELTDTLRHIHAGVRTAFSHIDDTRNQEELTELMKLRTGRMRRDRMEAWVEAVSSPPAPMMHPMAVAAAMMMGLPVPPPGTQGEEAELIAALDLSPGYDRDLEDLRDELRPRLSERFSGWCAVAGGTRCGNALLADVYLKAVKLMPFLRASDVVHEMMSGLEDRSSMTHVHAALETLSAFCKTQQKIIIRRNKEKKAAGTTGTTATPATPIGTRAASTPAGGINDVD